MLENLTKKINEQEEKIEKLNKEIKKIIEENGNRFKLKRENEFDILDKIKEKDNQIKKETEKLNIYRKAFLLKKKHINNYMFFHFNEAIKKLSLNGELINKRNINKIKKELSNNDLFENVSIVFIDYHFKIYTNETTYELYNLHKYNKDYTKEIFQSREPQECDIQDDKYYIALARNILKKQDSFNKRFFKLKTEVEGYCKEIEESEQVYLSSYLKDMYNGFEFIQF